MLSTLIFVHEAKEIHGKVSHLKSCQPQYYKVPFELSQLHLALKSAQDAPNCLSFLIPGYQVACRIKVTSVQVLLALHNTRG